MRIQSLRHPVSALVALVLALCLVGGAGVAAQGIPTTPPPDLAGGIAQGTCDAPGQVTIQVGDFVRIQQSELVGSQDVAFTLRTQRNVDSSLDALFGQTPYVFLVTDNANPGAAPVACGALGGVNANGQITVGLTAPDPFGTGRDIVVGVAIFGATTPTGPTTQPAAQPGQLPVQAYIAEVALTQPQPVQQQPVQPTTAPASPTAAPSTPEPTMAPTMAPTSPPTMPPTSPPTAPPTSPPTMPPPTMPPPTSPPPTAVATT
jgi:hypothetical protein